jgi:hypothetical protein
MTHTRTGTKRRAAAKKAEGKIKSTFKKWNNDDKENTYDNHVFDTETLDPRPTKKLKKDTNTSINEESNKKPAAKSEKNTKKGPASDKISSTNESKDGRSPWKASFLDASSPESEPDEECVAAAMEAEFERCAHHRRRAARMVHSHRAMFLSRRLSWTISKANEESFKLSPLVACHLTFTPGTCAILMTRRV